MAPCQSTDVPNRFPGCTVILLAVGLCAFSTIQVINMAFFALQDRKSPLKAAFVALFLNVILSIILMNPLKHGGLALATSISTAVNVLMLAAILRKKIGPFLDREFHRSLLKVVISSIIMGISIYIAEYFLSWNINGPLSSRGIYLAACICSGMIVFFVASVVTRNSELLYFLDHLKRRFSRG